MNIEWILAEASPNTPDVIKAEKVGEQTTAVTATDSNTPATKPQQPQSNPYMSWMLLGLMVVFLYFIMFRGPKKRQQQQQQMISSIKKNDRVRTIGGIFGTVLDVKDDEIVLKIDESNNTKLRVAPEAISKVLGEEKKD